MTDDGFNIGILYKGSRDKYGQAVERCGDFGRDLHEEFLV
jgi:hypothetical protein